MPNALASQAIFYGSVAQFVSKDASLLAAVAQAFPLRARPLEAARRVPLNLSDHEQATVAATCLVFVRRNVYHDFIPPTSAL